MFKDSMAQKDVKKELPDTLIVEVEDLTQVARNSMRISVVSNRRDDYSFYFSHGNAD